MGIRHIIGFLAVGAVCGILIPLLALPESRAQVPGRGESSLNPASAPPSFKGERALSARALCLREINQATQEWRLQVLKAKRRYRESLVQAKQIAMRSGNLDEANAVQAELKSLDAEIQTTSKLLPPPPPQQPPAPPRNLESESEGATTGPQPVAGLSRSTVLEMLKADRVWYWHWEDHNRDHSFRFVVDKEGRISNNNQPGIYDSLELRWVLVHDGHLLVPIDTQTFQGFHIQSGRQAGAFTDQKLGR